MTHEEFTRLAAEIAAEDESLNQAGEGQDRAIWQRLARGELNPEEEAALRARAAADPEVAGDYELYRPLEEEARARFARSVGRVRALSQKGRRRRPRWPLAAGLGALAAAAAVALLVPLWSAPVPGYSLHVQGVPAGTMAPQPDPGPSSVPCLPRDGTLEVRLQPDKRVSGPLEVRSFLVPPRGEPRPWQVQPTPSDAGAFLLRGRVAEMLAGVPDGRWEMAFAVGRPHGRQGPVIRRTIEIHARCPRPDAK